MNYLQEAFSKRLDKYKQNLNNKSAYIKKGVIEHCNHEKIVDFVKITQEKDNSLTISFPDLKLKFTSQDKFAFNDSLDIGFQTSFYHDEEFILSMTITQTGNVKFIGDFEEKYPALNHDEFQIPLILLHGLLSVAHRNGTILLLE